MDAMLDELAQGKDREAIEPLVQRLLLTWEADASEPRPDASDVIRRFGALYQDARVAGLCHDGAIEVFVSGIREYQAAMTSVVQSCLIPPRG